MLLEKERVTKCHEIAISIKPYIRNRRGPHPAQPLLFESLEVYEPEGTDQCDDADRQQVEEYSNEGDGEENTNGEGHCQDCEHRHTARTCLLATDRSRVYREYIKTKEICVTECMKFA